MACFAATSQRHFHEIAYAAKTWYRPRRVAAKAQVTTIQTKLLRMAAHFTVSVRRIVFHLSSYNPYQPLFALLVRRLTPI